MRSHLRTFPYIPFTLVMMAGLALFAIFTNTYFTQITRHWINRIGFAPRDFWYMRFERMFTSALVTSGGTVFWQALLLVGLFVGLAEWFTGTKRAALTFWGVHLLTLVLLSMIVSLALHQLRDFGLAASEFERDVGPSAGYFACLGLLSAQLKRPWNWVSGLLLFIMFAVYLFLPPGTGERAAMKFSADFAHLLAFPLGWLSSFFLTKRHP
jgi:uncharacterized membrane protein SirB2